MREAEAVLASEKGLDEAASGEGPALRPGALADRLVVDADTLRKYATECGVHTPGRGEKHFLYPPAAIRKIAQHAAANARKTATQRGAEGLLAEYQIGR